VVVVVMLMAWGAALEAWADTREFRRKVAVEVGGGLRLPVCEDYSVEGYAGTSCAGGVTLDAQALWTPGNAFLLRPALSIGVAYDSDAAAAHYYAEEGKQPIEDLDFTAALGVGAARRTRAVEVQFSIGPRLDIVALAARQRLAERGYDEDPYGEVWFGGEVLLRVDIVAGDTLLVGPRVKVAAGNEVSLMFGSDCTEAPAWCEDATSLNQDIEVEVLPTFGLLLPAVGPASFMIEVGPEIRGAAYTRSMHESLTSRNYDRPRTSTSVYPWLFVGMQLRR